LHSSLSFLITMLPHTSFKVDHSISPHLYDLAYNSGLDNLFTNCNISLVPSPVQELDLMVRVSKYHMSFSSGSVRLVVCKTLRYPLYATTNLWYVLCDHDLSPVRCD
jgi:hypothetical protein